MNTSPKVVCTVPTYNEVENIVDLADALLAHGEHVEVLVVDDDSPDGTAAAVLAAQATRPRLHLLHRTTDRGRGAAGRDGFLRALAMGADVVVEMDADFSHHPRYLPVLVETLLAERSPPLGLVVGSRAVAGGTDDDRGIVRRVITRLANAYIRLLLGLDVRDCNSGYRCWRADTLRRIEVEKTFSKGPAIVQELLFKTARAGIAIAETPIEFVDRVRGESTLTWRTLLTGYTTVLELRLKSLVGRL